MAATVYCLAPGCKNNSRMTEDVQPIVFYNRIKDDPKWHKFCSLNGKDKRIFERPEFALCSAHFVPDDYQDTGDNILFEDAVPTIPSAFKETKSMCYLCFSTSSECDLFEVDEDTQRELEKVGLSLVEITKVPPKFCVTCGKELVLLVNYLNRVRSANNFWQKFAINIGILNPISKLTVDEPAKRTFDCKDCDYKTTSKEYLFRHHWTVHTVNKDDPATCGICKKKLSNEYANRRHYLDFHYDGISAEPAICSECGHLARSKKHLTYHLRFKHGILSLSRPFDCEWCLKTYTTQKTLDDHMKQFHPEEFEAARQEKEKTHEEQVSDEESNHMDVDDRNSPYEDEDDLPLKAKTNPEPAKKEEPKKEKRAQETSNHNKPVKKRITKPSKDDVTKKCPDCEVEISGKEIMALGGLKRHYWVRHGRLSETPNICRGCKKPFNNEYCCRVHYFREHFDASFSCELCDKSGMTSTQYRLHKLRKHTQKQETNKKTLVCRFCKRKYETIEQMEEHEKEHEKDRIDRPFVCNECGKCYSSDKGLAHHLKIHMGIRPYKCQHCDQSFVSRWSCRVHEINHTGLSPYRCSLCDKDFNQLGNIHLHIAKHHGSFDKEVIHNEIIIRQNGATRKRKGKQKVVKKDEEEEEEYYQEGATKP